MEHDMEQFNKQVTKMVIAQDLEYWKGQQKNFSPEVDKIFEKVQNGQKLNELDVFTITCDNQQQIDEYAKFYNIRESIKDGNVKREDICFLIDTMCGNDEKTKSELLRGFEPMIARSEQMQAQAQQPSSTQENNL